jgi:hypothetical protein
MTPTVDDYWRAVDAFVSDMDRCGKELRSVILWGSMARNEVVPGKSDLLDAVVVSSPGVLGDRERFERVAREILASCEAMAATGLPFVHPPDLYGEEELGDMDDLYRSSLVSPSSSRVLLGDDLRTAMLGGPGAETVGSCAFFALQRRFMQPLLLFLLPLKLSETEQDTLLHRLAHLRKSFPILACAALGRPANQKDALAELRQALPEIDFSVFDEIAAVRSKTLAPDGPEALRTLLRRAFATCEQVNERVLTSRAQDWNELIVPA